MPSAAQRSAEQHYTYGFHSFVFSHTTQLRKMSWAQLDLSADQH